jgi:hypothetical protein
MTTVRRLASISDRLRNLERDKAHPGPGGDRGSSGNGTPGTAATVTVGTTTTGAAGSNAAVTNSGTSSAAVLDFTIPRGAAAFIDVRDYGGSPGASAATNTTALQAAITQANTVKMPVFLTGGVWAINSGAITIPQRFTMFGAGRDVTLISVAGTGTAFATATPGTRVFDWNLSGVTVTTSTASIAFDCDSLSTSVFRDIAVSGFSDVGFYLHSTNPGGSVYNRWYNCTVASTPTGYRLRGNSSNANAWHGCRANVCSIAGWDIQDGNDNSITSSQAENCGTGFQINATAPATANWNRLSNVRSEHNTIGVSVASSNVANTVIEGMWVDGSTTTPINDVGTTTRRANLYLWAQTINSILRMDTGWQFVSGGSVTLGTNTSTMSSATAAPLYLRGNAADAASVVGVWLGNGTTLTPGTDRRIAGFCRDTPVTHASPVSYVDSNGSYEFAPSGVRIQCGTGTPEGNVAAPVGSIYLRSDGGAASSAYVKESGTGATGWVVTAASVTVGTTTTGAAGSSASVTNSGTATAAVLNFTIPQGAKGDPGTPGTNGSPGTAATVAVGTTATGAAGSNAAVTNVGTTSAAVLNFTIPQGAQGTPGTNGTNGTAATVTVGTTTTGAAGSSATVVNTGTTSAAILQFTIPRGAGYTWRGVWVSGTAYAVNDVVTFQSHTYVCVAATSTTTAPTTVTTTPFALMSGGINPRLAAWSSGSTYYPGDAVMSGSHTFVQTYTASCTGSGTAPPASGNNTWWTQLTQGLVPRGAYSAVTAYNPGDVVNYNGYGFAAATATTGTAPTVGSDTAVWKRVADKGDPGAAGSPGTLAVTNQNFLGPGSTTWPVPANLEWVKIMLVAGGGGGGGTAGAASGVAQGAGGGGGAYAEIWLSGSVFASRVGSSITVFTGGGGAAGTGAGAGTGGTGGNSYFGASGDPWYILCGGGTGGQGMTAATGVQINTNGGGGAVAALPTGGLGIAGEDGQHGRTILNGSSNLATYLLNGGGGASHMSPGSLGGDSYIGTAHDGQSYGGGGGGGISSTANQDGGKGAGGLVRLTYATRS